jgi:phage repressor protein C with HTH and peptisase S24 domain
MENFNVGFASRMQEVVDILGSVSELSRRVEVAYPTASKWVKEGAEPSTTNLIKIAHVAQVEIKWLATGKGPKFSQKSANGIVNYHAEVSNPQAANTNDIGEAIGGYNNPLHTVYVGDYAFIPVYSTQDPNDLAATEGKAICTIAFNRNWLENSLNVDPQKLSTLIVKDDSMTGVLNDGDHVLINHSKKAGGDGLYVLRIGKNILIKRTQLKPNNQLLITSANSVYEPFTIDLADTEQNFEIIGKVEWFGRKI